MSTTTIPTTSVEACRLDALTPERGVAVVVDGVRVALFRVVGGSAGAGGDEVLAVDHVDPFTGVAVLARGLVGSVGERLVVISPLHKQRFDLRTGECLDDPDVVLRTWRTHVVDGVVHVESR
ncbi:nitrite reductase small subunit NirD [Actinomarinicola tropica]|uniref:Nitrite reductase small subunit NirD n=1 Tax=Actinomarinicola tropica TaxID=2789776 RepID=A0A5Q2RR70_9ACTN|nr:nitrite reductase small subunit NirD [Actinomarinicola tropica]QGG96400.1 nitrite reductase small subunit NirD [Actinomarinicola tropica]